MRDLVPELSSGSSEDEASMMKHLEGSQQPQPCENYMTHNCVTIIPVEYPRSDSSSLSATPLRGLADKRDYAALERHSPYVLAMAPRGRQLPTPTHHPHHCYLSPSVVQHHQPPPPQQHCQDDGWRIPRERIPAPQHPLPTPPPATKQEICVYLLTKVCLCVEVNSLPMATSDEIVEIIAQDDAEMNLPSQATEFFALWMTSPLLELQLKPDHRPYLIRERWSEYLKKYTFASKRQLETDEPVLTFQRNVFLDKEKEKEMQEMKVVRMLYAEARGNVLDGRYPCETEDCIVLGAIQARLELGPYDPAKHTLEFFRTRIRDFLPEHACRSHWFLLGLGAKNGPERRLAEHYRATPSSIKDLKLMRKYLEFCWAFPYYGSAFFQGQVERPVTGIAALMNHYDLPVLVAINREGVHVIDPSQPVVLMSLQYRQMSWDYACPAQPQNPDCLPCLFLQFQQPGQADTSVVQIFSKQAVLMDALISTIVDELKRRPSWNKPDVDPTTLTTRPEDDVQVPLTVKKIRQEQGLSCRLRKLSIAKFSSAGDYLNSRGSLEFKRDSRPR
ncbi:FERM domain-containing protein 8 isoform X3 [Ixodes scapularis]|nr:FERM domain-containing protein 8 isoform X3 [Ixodes scapularis]XP_040357217.1 FERM domain-containing protein 8 isoform X3 [Ixodes scapularis]